MEKNIDIAYFSGTGGTKKIASEFQIELTKRQYIVKMHSMDSSKEQDISNDNSINLNSKLLLILFPVYAFDAPQIVYDWISKLKKVKEINTAVISVSGGGISWPNTLCRVYCIRALEKKGYRVFYERMMVMPSNFCVKTDDKLSMWLIKSIPQKVKEITDDIIAGKYVRDENNFFAGVIHIISSIEKHFSRSFGNSLKAGSSCNGCGWCEANCPRANIEIFNDKPIFKNQCIMCMRCIYGCPQNVIYTDKYKFLVLKDGFSIKSFEDKMKVTELEPVEGLKGGILWEGVKRYLLENNRAIYSKGSDCNENIGPGERNAK